MQFLSTLVLLLLVPLTLAAKGKGKGSDYEPVPTDKGCYDTKHCRREEFEEGDRPQCYGMYSCLGAKMMTSATGLCIGAASCYHAKFDSSSTAKVLCSGYKACQKHQGKLDVSTKIMCNGLKSCTRIGGGLMAPEVICDGDLTCSNFKDTEAQRPMSITAETKVACNGKIACRENFILATEGEVMCDGDTACAAAQIRARDVRVYGKKVCKECTIFAHMAEVYGHFGGAMATIDPMDTDLTVKAYGFNALAGATLMSRVGGSLTVEAFGFSAMSGALMTCPPNGVCTIHCKGNACKDAVLVVTPFTDLTLTPSGCNPCDEAFACSLKDSSKPAKQGSDHCPIVYVPRFTGERGDCPPVECAYEGTPDEAALESVRQTVREELDELDKADEESLNQYFDQLLAVYDEDVPDLDEYDTLEEEEAALDEMLDSRQETLMFGVQSAPLMETVSSSQLIVTNLMTALCALVVCAAAVCYYYTRHVLQADARYKSIPDYE